MKRLLIVCFSVVCIGVLRGQQMDNPVTFPVSYYGEGVVQTSYQPWSQLTFGSTLGASTTGSGSYLIGGTTVFSPLTTTSVIPGKDYTVQVTSSNFAVVVVRFPDVPGYEVYLGPNSANMRINSLALGSNYTFHFRLEAINDITRSLEGKRGGEASSLVEDKPIWYVGLGSLKNGRFAGAVGFLRGDFTADLYRTSALIYDSVDTSEVAVVRNSSTGYIESITSPELKVEMDTYDALGTQYDIRVKRMNPDASVGATFITYTVKQHGSNAGVLIIKNENTSIP